MIRSKGFLGGLTALVFMAFAPMAFAGIGFFFDASTLRFDYVKGAGGPGSVGKITVQDAISSAILVQHLELGNDGFLGTLDDVVLDIARISDNNFFKVLFTADVFKIGANSYSIQGSLGIGDMGSPPDVVVGGFTSTDIQINGSLFQFSGDLSNPAGLLQPGPGGQWIFEGDPAVTPDMINGKLFGEDGVDGTVTLPDGRDQFTNGNLVDFQLVGNFSDLDSFFNQNQGSNGADMKIKIVPVPAALLLGLIGLAGSAVIRRRQTA